GRRRAGPYQRGQPVGRAQTNHGKTHSHRSQGKAGMTQALRIPGPGFRQIPHWRAAFLPALLAMFAGCAHNPGATPAGGSTVSRSVEPMTASDEPETRKRARIRLELAAGYFEQGQTKVALDEIKLSLAADPSYATAYTLRGLVY